MIKGSIHLEDITPLSICASNKRTSKYIKQKLPKFQGETKKPTIIVRDLHTIVSTTKRTNKQKISRDIEMLNSDRQLNLIY